MLQSRRLGSEAPFENIPKLYRQIARFPGLVQLRTGVFSVSINLP
jgi:hypothetical protein